MQTLISTQTHGNKTMKKTRIHVQVNSWQAKPTNNVSGAVRAAMLDLGKLPDSIRIPMERAANTYYASGLDRDLVAWRKLLPC